MYGMGFSREGSGDLTKFRIFDQCIYIISTARQGHNNFFGNLRWPKNRWHVLESLSIVFKLPGRTSGIIFLLIFLNTRELLITIVMKLLIYEFKMFGRPNTAFHFVQNTQLFSVLDTSTSYYNNYNNIWCSNCIQCMSVVTITISGRIPYFTGCPTKIYTSV